MEVWNIRGQASDGNLIVIGILTLSSSSCALHGVHSTGGVYTVHARLQ